METDFSKEIYDNYYNVKDRIVEIIMKDNRILEGKLVSFFHGNKESNEPFITKWHFVDKNDIQEYQKGLVVSIEGNQEIGTIIDQKNIREVRFKSVLA
jgi:hypothetical protein